MTRPAILIFHRSAYGIWSARDKRFEYEIHDIADHQGRVTTRLCKILLPYSRRTIATQSFTRKEAAREWLHQEAARRAANRPFDSHGQPLRSF